MDEFSRVSNGGNGSIIRIGHNPDDEEDEKLLKRPNNTELGANRLRGWHHSSRIIRVSRASGGKDRHSKVWTSKGPRDRRVRLSVTTAIQFYDLQDRLGYDQPSKAVEWLIKAAADSISELPSLNGCFSETPEQQLSDDNKRNCDNREQGFDDSAEGELEGIHFNNQIVSLSKSASSNSETSKGSGLSLSRSEVRVNRVKARERARERVKKEVHHNENNPITQSSTFTELLASGGISSISNNGTSPCGTSTVGRQWPSTLMDYFGAGLLGPSSSQASHTPSEFSSQIQLGNSLSQAMPTPLFSNQQHELQNFPFATDHLIPVASIPKGENNFNFARAPSGLAGINRGTLQSNSPSLLPHLQRFSSQVDGTSVPFFLGTPPLENHNHHYHFPPGLHLFYGDGSRHPDHKGKGKN